MGAVQADQDTSFQAMKERLLQIINIVKSDPAIATFNAFTGGDGGGGATTNTAAHIHRRRRSRSGKSRRRW